MCVSDRAECACVLTCTCVYVCVCVGRWVGPLVHLSGVRVCVC